MRIILKILLLPIRLALGIITLFLEFILGIGTFLLNLVSIFCIFGALASFINGEVGLGIWGLVMAFLFSPYGIPMIGAVAVAFIAVVNKSLGEI